jgi:hypothetical protein
LSLVCPFVTLILLSSLLHILQSTRVDGWHRYSREITDVTCYADILDLRSYLFSCETAIDFHVSYLSIIHYHIFHYLSVHVRSPILHSQRSPTVGHFRCLCNHFCGFRSSDRASRSLPEESKRFVPWTPPGAKETGTIAFWKSVSYREIHDDEDNRSIFLYAIVIGTTWVCGSEWRFPGVGSSDQNSERVRDAHRCVLDPSQHARSFSHDGLGWCRERC